MNRITLITIIITVVMAVVFALVASAKVEAPVTIVQATSTPAITTYAQEVWINALEWCESGGNPEAINPSDSDGTPSYYSFQFKSSTFRGLGEKYGVIDKGLSYDVLMTKIKETDLQRAIVRYMIKDKDIRIQSQFPGCVRKIGFPPQY